MAYTPHNTQTRSQVALVGLETTFGTLASTMVRDYIINETFDLSGLSQGEVANADQRANLFQYLAKVRGLKSASKFKFGHYAKVAGTQLTAAATAATPYLGLLLKGLMGAEYSAAGSAVVTATSNTITVTSTQGTRFATGQWIGVGVAGVIEPCRVVHVSGDQLTLNPQPSAQPAGGQLVINSYTYYPTQTNAQSLSVQFGYVANELGVGGANPDLQWQLLGCTGDFGLSFDRAGILRAEFDLTCASPSAPSALSLGTTNLADTMTGMFPMRDAQILLQPTATATKTQYALHGLSCKFDNGMTFVPELGSSGVEGVIATMRVGASRPYATVTAKFPADVARHTDWTNQTQSQLVVMVPLGSGTTKRWVVIDFPTVIPVGWPKVTAEGGRALMEQTFECALDTTPTVADTTDLGLAPARIALI